MGTLRWGICALATTALATTAAMAQPYIINSNNARADRLEVLVLDLGGNGIELGGDVASDLLTPGLATLRWTKPGSDDGFLTCQVDLLTQLGLDPALSRGRTGSATRLLFRGVAGASPLGGAVKRPGPKALEIWAALGILDANHDGELNADDPAWSRLWVFVDANGNGMIDPGEERSLPDAGISALRLAADEHGNREFVRAGGKTGLVQAVVLAGSPKGRARHP